MNTINESSKAANALGGKTARACESCLVKRARWFCTAYDAFLCQACDGSVHSANQLASRHERVRLETASFKANHHEVKMMTSSCPEPAWHQGFTRKARTPRQGKTNRPHNPLPLVPEINGDDQDPFFEENHEDDNQLLHSVPVFDPFADDNNNKLNLEEMLLSTCNDVEGLLGQDYGVDIDLGFEGVDSICDQDQELENIIVNDHEVLLGDEKRVKVEEDNDDDDDEVKAVIACHFHPALDMELNWDFDDYGSNSSSMTGEEFGEEIKKVETLHVNNINENDESQDDKSRMLLRLNYEAVIAAWASQGSPWTDGVRPQFNLNEFMDACLGGSSHPYVGFVGRSGANDAGREARVSRYREKRRTRLFSKKIRYQVRKLNAEKRPRMKGRFVKKANFPGPSLPNYVMNK